MNISPAFGYILLAVFILIVVHYLWLYDSDHPLHLNHVSNIYLWTRDNQIVAEDLVEAITHSHVASSFSSSRTTYVIIHGFLSSALYNWVIGLKDALLLHENCNVLAVSWQSGSSRLSYYAVQSRVPDVGEEVARLLQLMQEQHHLRLDKVHLIGHSLGAHISGFAAKHFNGSLARISGLDPAGMGFNDAEPHERLDKTDAQFVDVIHTHACSTLIQTFTCYGTTTQIGHVDFWVNGGEEQPACVGEGDGPQVLQEGAPCSHSMSYVYFIESVGYVAKSGHFIARHCASREHFYNGTCTCPAWPQMLGLHANKWSVGNFYLNTSSTWPYALVDTECPAFRYTKLDIVLFICLFLVAFMLAALAVAGVLIVATFQYPDFRHKFSPLWLYVFNRVLEYS